MSVHTENITQNNSIWGDQIKFIKSLEKHISAKPHIPKIFLNYHLYSSKKTPERNLETYTLKYFPTHSRIRNIKNLSSIPMLSMSISSIYG